MRAVISTGSNMGDAAAHLASVVAALAPVATSSIYETAPWGGVEQPPFLNQVLIMETDLDPHALLAKCQRLEHEAERVRDVRWGPRTLDVDIVDIDGYTSDDPALTVPHPRAHLREFVLRPWLEVEPGATLDDVPVADLLATLEPQGVARVGEEP